MDIGIGALLSGGAKALKLHESAAKLVGGMRTFQSRRFYGGRVYELRRQVGLARGWLGEDDEVSQAGFADMLGFNEYEAITEIEGGRRPPKADDLARLTDGTGALRRHLIDGSVPLWADLRHRLFDPVETLSLIDQTVTDAVGVRVDAPDGNVAVILHGEDWQTAKLAVFDSFHFGERVGGTGRSHQERFLMLRCALSPLLAPRECEAEARGLRDEIDLPELDLHLGGRTPKPDAFRALADGQLHPIAFLAGHVRNDDWFMDFADVVGRSLPLDRYERDFGPNFATVQRNVRYELELGEFARS